MFGIEDFCFFVRDAVREIFEKSFLGKIGEAIALLNACPHRHGGELSRQSDEILPRIGCPRCDIDKRRDLRVDSRFANDGAAPGMGDQHGRSILQRQCAACGGDRIGERCQRILHRGDMQAGRLKARDDLGPAGAVRPRSVHQHHIARFRRLGGPR